MGAGEWRDEQSCRRIRRARPCSTSPAAGGPTAGSGTGGWCPGPCRASSRRRVDARPGPAGAVHHRLQLRADRRPGRLQRRGDPGDVLVYSSDPLVEPLELIGAVRVVAHVATSAADTDVTAKLVDVHPDGFAQRLCDGVVRLRYRNGFGRAEPVTRARCTRSRSRCGTPACGCRPGTGCGRDRLVRVPEVRRQPRHRRRHDHRDRRLAATNRLWHTPSRPSACW